MRRVFVCQETLTRPHLKLVALSVMLYVWNKPRISRPLTNPWRLPGVFDSLFLC